MPRGRASRRLAAAAAGSRVGWIRHLVPVFGDQAAYPSQRPIRGIPASADIPPDGQLVEHEPLAQPGNHPSERAAPMGHRRGPAARADDIHVPALRLWLTFRGGNDRAGADGEFVLEARSLPLGGSAGRRTRLRQPPRQPAKTAIRPRHARRQARGSRYKWPRTGRRHRLNGYFSSPHRNDGSAMLSGGGGQPQPWAIVAAATTSMGHRCGCPAR